MRGPSVKNPEHRISRGGGQIRATGRGRAGTGGGIRGIPLLCVETGVALKRAAALIGIGIVLTQRLVHHDAEGRRRQRVGARAGGGIR